MLQDPRYDRSRLIDAAARAVARGRLAKAIALYRWVLALEPQNADLHLKLAPLLARAGQRYDAWLSFHAAARALLRNGQPDRALAVYRQAASVLPREVKVWQSIARIQQRGGRERDAVDTLLEGSRHLRRTRLRPRAIHLLRLAREIEPWHFESVRELARLLGRSAQREEAGLLLRGLARRCGGERLRRVRAAEVCLSPTPGNAWRWLRATVQTPPEPRERSNAGPDVVRLRRVSARGRP
jgi:tetratricopeptide (TPR) repeat protein